MHDQDRHSQHATTAIAPQASPAKKGKKKKAAGGGNAVSNPLFESMDAGGRVMTSSIDLSGAARAAPGAGDPKVGGCMGRDE